MNALRIRQIKQELGSTLDSIEIIIDSIERILGIADDDCFYNDKEAREAMQKVAQRGINKFRRITEGD